MDYSRLSGGELRGLQLMRKRIANAKVPQSTLDTSLNLCTWNIRHWGQKRRLRFSLYCIAEVFDRFDLIAVTELRRNVSELRYVLDLLGPYWKAVFSDYVADWGGNRERIAFVYDSRTVRFTGLAAESDGPRTKDKATGQYVPDFNWWRKPYMASFRAGHFDFVLLAVHIQWGTKGGREAELAELAKWVSEYQKDEYRVDRDVIVLGDFNIPGYDTDLYRAVARYGLRAPQSILQEDLGSNLKRNKRYDQILYHPKVTHEAFSDRGGIIDFYRGDHAVFEPYSRMSKEEFTYQLSDHLPVWVQLRTSDPDGELEALVQRKD